MSVSMQLWKLRCALLQCYVVHHTLSNVTGSAHETYRKWTLFDFGPKEPCIMGHGRCVKTGTFYFKNLHHSRSLISYLLLIQVFRSGSTTFLIWYVGEFPRIFESFENWSRHFSDRIFAIENSHSPTMLNWRNKPTCIRYSLLWSCMDLSQLNESFLKSRH